MKNGLILSLLFFSFKAWGQAPTSSFNAVASACLQQTIPLQNTSLNSDSYEWDFCADDFNSLKSSIGWGPIGTLQSGEGFKLIHDNGLWYGFASSRDNNLILRYDFGSSPENKPTLGYSGNPGGLLHSPEGLDVIKVNGNWFIFVGSLDFVDPTSGIIRLDLGSSLTNTPVSTNLGNFGLNSRIRNVSVVQQGSNLILILVNYNGGTITRVNYGNSFNNSISAGDISDIGSITGLPVGFNLLKNGSNWIAHLSSLNGNTITQLNFGSDILSTPVVEGTYAFTGVSNPDKLRVIQEGSQYFAVVSNDSRAFTIINFKDLNPASTPSEIVTSGLPGMWGIDVTRWMGRNIVLGLGNVTNEIKKVVFESNCGANLLYSTNASPFVIYSTSGSKQIELLAKQSGSGSSSISSVTIPVSGLTSPDIKFQVGGICVSQNLSFTPISNAGNISNYAWNFGDDSTSINPSPTHSYSHALIYYPSLTVTAGNNCQNFVKDTLQTFNPPMAGFTLPFVTPLCTNQTYIFTDTSKFDTGSKPNWQWSVNGVNVDTTKNLSYSFSSTVSQSITLTASIPGCSTQSTQNITTLVDGPRISFTAPSTGCAGDTISFKNTTTDPVSNFSWTFGDGNTSTQTNSSNIYHSNNTYLVTLSGTNANGCQNSSSQNVLIHSSPQPDFSIEAPPLSCSNWLSKFDNQTPSLTDSNVSTWEWSFGDANNGTSDKKTPSYNFTQSGNFTVTLKATTNFGCVNSKQKQIFIHPSPDPGFGNTPACKNQETSFTANSTTSISYYQWSIQNNIKQGPTLTTTTYSFNDSGNFPVTLTVTGTNFCLAQKTKNVIVPQKPTLDFSIQGPCLSDSTIFTETDVPGTDSDNAIGWNWDFGNLQGGGTGSSVKHKFTDIKGYTVTLNSTRLSGCVYTLSKNVDIGEGPKASFTTSVIAGAAPLTVDFTNTSQRATTSLWQFGDPDGSTNRNYSDVQFTYQQLGHYKAILTAMDDNTCSDTTSTEIDVVIPRIDMVMNNFSLTNDPGSNSSKAVVTILNSGNMPLVNPMVLIDFGGEASVKEQLSGMIRPGHSLVQTLDLQFIPYSLQFICAEINVANDVDSLNNKQCLAFSNDVVLDPYPNPASTGQIILEWIGSSEENVLVTIFKSTGEIAFEQHLNEVQAGLGQLLINTSSFASGLYLIQFAGSKTTKTFKIVIAN